MGAGEGGWAQVRVGVGHLRPDGRVRGQVGGGLGVGGYGREKGRRGRGEKRKKKTGLGRELRRKEKESRMEKIER